MSATEPGGAFAISVSDEMLGRIADMAATRIKRGSAEHEPWMGTGEAAAYLACSRQRIYDLVHARRVSGIPHRKEGGRLLFRRSELDRWLEEGAS